MIRNTLDFFEVPYYTVDVNGDETVNEIFNIIKGL